MAGTGRGLRAAGRRRRVGGNPGQDAGGRHARPGRRVLRARFRGEEGGQSGLATFANYDIEHAVGESSYLRGLDYFRRGMVRSVKFGGPGRIHGEVSGSRPEPYAVVAKYESGSGGTIVPVEGNCSCPVGHNCKHTAAVLLAARYLSPEAADSAAGSAGEGASADVRRWLEDWPGAAPARPDARPAGPPEPGRNHLFYVVLRDETGGMRIDPYRAYLKQDGEIGRNVREYREGTASAEDGFVTAEDAAFLGRLGHYRRGIWPLRYDWPEGEELVALVREIVETGRARADDIRGMALSWSAPRRCALSWEVDGAGRQRVAARDDAGARLTLLPFPTPLFLDPNTGEIGVAETGLPEGLAAWFAAAPPVERDSVPAVAAKLSRIGRHAPVPKPHRVEERNDLRPEPVLKLFGCEHRPMRYAHDGRRLVSVGRGDAVLYPCARLEVVYPGAGGRLRAGQGDDIAVKDGDRYAIVRRDRAREAGFLETLREAARPHAWSDGERLRHGLGGQDEMPDADIVFPPPGGEEDDASGAGAGFAARAVPRLRAAGWRIEVDGSWPFRLHEGPVGFSTALEDAENDWFSLRLSLEADGKKFDVAPMVLQLVAQLPVDEWGRLEAGFDVERHLAGRSFQVRLDDGSWVVLDAMRFAPFAEAFLEAQGLLDFHRADVGRLFALAEALEGSGAPWTGGRELLDLGARLRALAEAPEEEPPASLKGELRPYQRTGYGWLKALSESGFGGVLADDMGLGKTVQTLALLAYRHLEEKAERPSLLVVPTSLVGNWRREAARFVPDLKLLVLHGPDRRKRFAEIAGHHLIVTTYPLLDRDGDALFDRDYEIAVLDEAQAAKNPASAVAKRIREIRARQRLALTGTPVENSLQELWALYDWLVPGLLGNRKKFTTEFRTPIEKHGDRARQRLLAARVKPFLMRRTKEEVAPELPERTVIDETIPLEGAQAALYESIRTTMDGQIREAIAAQGIAASNVAIFEALLNLRQVCCDPGLVKFAATRKVTASAKRARLLALLEELVAEGRRVLVFSQFVEMLKLIERDIAARGWGYAMLHGSTKDRDGQVAAFQSGDLPLFLASLKAGGTGLNLTAADTVIVYDPWWNPAAERQAMDRAHRIGQDKPVFVHRLIAENTVEAAIQRMQARKQGLADALFEGTGRGPLGLTGEDIDALFGPAQTGSPAGP